MARAMKDSGIEWIGEIPAGWESKRLKYIVSYNDESLGEDTDPDYEFDYIDIGSVEYGKGITQYQHMQFADSPSRARRVVRDKDVILSTVRTYLKAVATIDDRDNPQIASTGFIVLRAKKGQITPDYLHYSVLSNAFVSLVEAKSTGISYPAINASDVVEIKIPVPPIIEQRRIADYLNSECARIDAVIEQTRASIEEYKKLKQSLITQAVTKGIRPGRKMKDSGVEWIGEIPEEWTCEKFKYIAMIKSNLVQPDDYLDYPQVSPENIEKGSGKLLPCRTVREVGVISGNHLFFKGQVLYSKIRPKLNKVTIAPFDGLCSADMYPIETKINTEFFVYELRADSFLSQISLITEDRVKMPKINQDELGNIPFAVPPGEEQEEIVSFLNEKCVSFDRIIDKKELLIADLESYRKSLIFEYVTGKKVMA